MEISLFAKCIKELIVENDRVDVPYLGTFTAVMMPAAYSDRQTTIQPPYRKMGFHKAEITLSEGRPLLEKVRQRLGVTFDQAGIELGWCLSRLSSELEGHKSCKLPGLGTMRSNARGEYYFVPDDDLDIWPDGIGFEPVSIKMPKDWMPGQAGHDGGGQVGQDGDDQAEGDGLHSPDEYDALRHPRPDRGSRRPGQDVEEMPGQAGHDEKGQAGQDEGNRPATAQSSPARHPLAADTDSAVRFHWGWIVLIILAALLVLFIAASYLFTEQMSPILDRLLYSKEELELLRWR